MTAPLYYRTDEENEATDALYMAARFAEQAATDIRMWRWVIMALHNAVQGFMVLSLRHGNGLAALTEESAAAWLAAYEANATTYPEEKLDSYLCLYKKIKSTTYGTIGGNQNFVPRGSQGRSIRKLNRIRNDFIHFTPKGWSLELAGLPRICLDALALLSFLGWETSNILWHDERALMCAKSSCEKLSATLGITKPTALPGYVEMPESAGTVHVTKLAAAQRQLRAAIRLYFANEDELAIHTVASAAYRLISDLKAARGMNEAADSHLVSIFYVVRSFRRGTLPRHISENAEMMRWVTEMAEQMPITADSTPDEVTVVHIGAEVERAFWRSRNEASNFLKHADKDAQAHIGLDKIDNLSLLMQTMAAYTHLVKNDLGAEGLVLWLFASVSHGETETLPERFQVTAQNLLAIDDNRRREFCHALVCEFRAKAASDA